QPVIPIAESLLANPLIVFHAEFGRNYLRFFLKQVGIESCGNPNRLRKNSRVALARSAMQTFAPPVVSGNSESRNSRVGVHRRRRFLFQSQPRDNIVTALLDRHFGIATTCGLAGTTLRECSLRDT